MSKQQKLIQDERVTMEEKKYRSEALLMIEVILILSIITKEYILKLPLEASTGDWVLLIVAAAYPFVRGLLAGGGQASQYTPQRHGKVIGGLVTASVAVAAIVTLLSYQRYADKYQSIFDPLLLAVFGVAFGAMMVCNAIVYGITRYGARRAQERIDNQLDEE